MGILESIGEAQKKHRKKTVTIDPNLMEPEIQLFLELDYKFVLRSILDFFPYILKNQAVEIFQKTYGVSRRPAYEKVMKLVHSGVLGQSTWRGIHYLYPLKKALVWKNKNPKGKGYNKTISEKSFLDYFMRVEYLLTEGSLTRTDIRNLFRKYISNETKSPLQLNKDSVLSLRFNSNINTLSKMQSDTPEQQIEVVIKALEILTLRNCYPIQVNFEDNNFSLELIISHFDDSTSKRYASALVLINLIADCFLKNTMGKDNKIINLTVLAEEKYQAMDAKKMIERALTIAEHDIKDINTFKKLLIKKIDIKNTNIARRYQARENSEVRYDIDSDQISLNVKEFFELNS